MALWQNEVPEGLGKEGFGEGGWPFAHQLF